MDDKMWNVTDGQRKAISVVSSTDWAGSKEDCKMDG